MSVALSMDVMPSRALFLTGFVLWAYIWVTVSSSSLDKYTHSSSRDGRCRTSLPPHSAKGNSFTVNMIFPHKGIVPPQIIFEPFALLVVQNKHKPVWEAVLQRVLLMQGVILFCYSSSWLAACWLLDYCPCGPCEQSRSMCLSFPVFPCLLPRHRG